MEVTGEHVPLNADIRNLPGILSPVCFDLSVHAFVHLSGDMTHEWSFVERCHEKSSRHVS
jgi:hypothetical protein